MKILGKAILRLWAGQTEGINPAALAVFDKEIEKYTWVLREDGKIVSGSTKEGDPEIQLVIDIDDPGTVETFNLLPLYFKKINPKRFETMALRVIVHPSVDLMYWSPEENNDSIVFTKTGLAVASIHSIWSGMAIALEAFEDEG